MSTVSKTALGTTVLRFPFHLHDEVEVYILTENSTVKLTLSTPKL